MNFLAILTACNEGCKVFCPVVSVFAVEKVINIKSLFSYVDYFR